MLYIYSKYKANYSNLSMEFPEQIVVREQILKKVPQLFLKYKNKCKDNKFHKYPVIGFMFDVEDGFFPNGITI